MRDADVIVIGAGMAGASVAASLADAGRVTLIEGESRAGYHSTGRSAALFTEIYGNEVIRALTRASRAFLESPPAGFAESPLLKRRGSLFIATAAQLPLLDEFEALPDVAPATHRVSPAEALRLCPILKEGYVAAAVFEPESADIDVAALHQGFLKSFRGRGGTVLTGSPVTGLERGSEGWTVRAGAAVLTGSMIVNAAGAWADEVARLAGVSPLGLEPKRRTAVLIEPPTGIDVRSWPFVNDIEERFYFKPEGGMIFLSPADETTVPPADVQPDEWDIATAIERVEGATTLRIGRLQARWAGLRTFAADRTPVVGYSSEREGFFWLAGQGGYGIQTAPALARAAAALIQGLPLPADLGSAGVTAALLAPGRLDLRPANAPC